MKRPIASTSYTAHVHKRVLEVTEAEERTAIIAVELAQWYTWLEANRAFRFDDDIGTFSARKERRGRHWYWYAYRNIRGVVRLTYLGKSSEVTWERMVSIGMNYEKVLHGIKECPSPA